MLGRCKKNFKGPFLKKIVIVRVEARHRIKEVNLNPMSQSCMQMLNFLLCLEGLGIFEIEEQMNREQERDPNFRITFAKVIEEKGNMRY